LIWPSYSAYRIEYKHTCNHAELPAAGVLGTHQAPQNRGLVEIEIDLRKAGTGKVALVVEDNLRIRRAIASVFLSDGFETCFEAENGREGIELARKMKPDVIILDLSMPVMNGLQTASELRKFLPSVPIILFTLYADSISQTQASRAGVNAENRAPFHSPRKSPRTYGQLSPVYLIAVARRKP
jgi:CheY-like chemotaxis protein